MKQLLRYHWVIITFLYAFAVTYITYPLLFNLGNFITGYGDELLIAWIHNWVIHALFTDSFSLFNANIYHPYTNTLAYSDLFLTTSILGAIPQLIIVEPIGIVNVTIISSLLFLAIASYALSYYLSKDILASFTAGLLVIFSPAVIDKFVHIQILAIAFVPFAILFWLLFLNTKKTRYLIASMLFFIFQTINSFLPGYFIFFSILIITGFYSYRNKKKALFILTRKNLLLIIISLALLIPIGIPYFSVSHEFNYVRDIRETIHLALQPEDLLYAHPSSRFEPILSTLQSKENHPNADFKYGFIGFIFTILVIFSCIKSIRNFKKEKWEVNALFATGVFGLIMSLGPFLHLFRETIHYPTPIPLPYALFYYIVPGFQGIRNSARWEMLFILAMAVVVAFVLSKVLAKIDRKKKLILYTILFVGIIMEFNFPITYQQTLQKQDFPQVYYWINTTPEDTTIVEMPIYTWDMQPYVMDENMREYYATVHFRKMVNGASGFSPPPWQSMVKDLLSTFPDDRAVTKLSSMDVDYIIVHKSEYDRLYENSFSIADKRIPNGDTVILNLNKNESLKLIKQFGQDYVYQIIK